MKEGHLDLENLFVGQTHLCGSMHKEVSEDFLSFFPVGTARGWARLHHPPQASTEGSR